MSISFGKLILRKMSSMRARLAKKPLQRASGESEKSAELSVVYFSVFLSVNCGSLNLRRTGGSRKTEKEIVV